MLRPHSTLKKNKACWLPFLGVKYLLIWDFKPVNLWIIAICSAVFYKYVAQIFFIVLHKINDVVVV